MHTLLLGVAKHLLQCDSSWCAGKPKQGTTHRDQGKARYMYMREQSVSACCRVSSACALLPPPKALRSL
jgi:hypothetical protein